MSDLDNKINTCRDDYTELLQGFDHIKQQNSIDKLTLHKYEETVQLVQQDLVQQTTLLKKYIQSNLEQQLNKNNDLQ